MKVKLISMTPSPIDVMWTAARTCYSAKSPIEMWEGRYGDDCEHTQEYIDQCVEKHWELVKKVLSSGHESIAENVVFTFSIQEVSRSLTHQLVRHRLACYSQQSQRYVNFKDRELSYVYPWTIERNKEAEEIYDKFMNNCKETYDKLVNLGIPAEDARYVLPNAACTNINMTVNLRELKHICALRLCTRAQLEIRQLFQDIKKEVESVEPRLAALLVPTCEVHGMCFEDKCCGRKPRVNEVKGAYKLLEGDDTILSGEDWEQLMENINNPKVNDKLAEFMKSKNKFRDR